MQQSRVPARAVLRMRRFDQARLLDRLARSDALTAGQVDSLAAGLVHFHALAAPAPPASPHGSAALVRRWGDASLAQPRGCLEDAATCRAAPRRRRHAQRVRARAALLHGLSRAGAGALVPRVVAMSGLTGSGKSVVAKLLAERCDAVCVRSDVERNRLFGPAPATRAPADQLYTLEATASTYARLQEVVRCCVDGGVMVRLVYHVIYRREAGS